MSSTHPRWSRGDYQVWEIPPAPPSCSGQLHVVVAGETLTSIALAFGVSVQDILRANPQITNPNVIFAGQVICIPTVTPIPCPNGFIYTVQSGETLSAIARRFGITLQALLAANPQITNPDVIQVGQQICIPTAPPPPPPVRGRRCLVMTPTMRVSNAEPVALLDFNRPFVAVSVADVPSPADMGGEIYVAWLRRPANTYLAFPMVNCRGSDWMVSSALTEPLGNFESILITAEPRTPPAAPSGLTVASGRLTEACPST